MRHRASRPVLDRWRRLRPATAGALAGLAALSPVRALVALTLVIGLGTGVYATVSSVTGGSSSSAADHAALGQRSGHPVSRGGERPDLAYPSPSFGPTPDGDTARKAGQPREGRSAARRVTEGVAAASAAPAGPSARSGEPATPSTTPDPPSATTSRSNAPSSPTPVDRRPPETRVSAEYPAGDVAVFSFGSNEPASFTCSLDGEPYTACDSPTRYPDLAPGQHTFSVRAADDAGNVDPSPAEVRWVANKGR